jgi:glycosyltransferase involved in cell wall biosynthesis
MDSDGKMFKVCMITIKHSPFDDRLFYKEGRSLISNGYYVYITTAASRINEDYSKEYGNLKIEYIAVKTRSKVLNRVLALPMLFFKSLHTHADIYHSHEPETFPLAVLLKFFTGKRIIYDVYEYYPDVIPLSNGIYKYFLIFMTYIFEPLFCRFADGIITADSEIARRYIKFNKAVCTLYNFPCLDIFKPEAYKKEMAKKYKGKEVIIYVGGLSEVRGILELVKAVHNVSKKCPTVKLLLVGWFQEENFNKKCIEYIKSNDLGNNIELIGSVPHINIPEYIYSAQIGAVLLHPIQKFYKNIPTKQFEYMACKKPVVGSNLPTISQFINDAKCGILVNPTKIDEITDAILYLIEHPEEAKKMGENGRRAVLEKYNWKNEEEKLLNFYDKILEELSNENFCNRQNRTSET